MIATIADMRCYEVFDSKRNFKFYHPVINGILALQIHAIQIVKFEGLFHELLI
jgi:hypothetical protein